jgi:hypothetical protein
MPAVIGARPVASSHRLIRGYRSFIEINTPGVALDTGRPQPGSRGFYKTEKRRKVLGQQYKF